MLSHFTYYLAVDSNATFADGCLHVYCAFCCHNRSIRSQSGDNALVMLSDFAPEAAGKCGYEPKREIEYCIGTDKAQKLWVFSFSKTYRGRTQSS